MVRATNRSANAITIITISSSSKQLTTPPLTTASPLQPVTSNLDRPSRHERHLQKKLSCCWVKKQLIQVKIVVMVVIVPYLPPRWTVSPSRTTMSTTLGLGLALLELLELPVLT